MSLIKLNQFQTYLTNVKKYASVYLIHGDEFFYKKVLNSLIKKIIPESSINLNYEAVDGSNDNIALVLEKLNTYSLIPDNKIVAMIDSRLFYQSLDKDKIFEKIETAYNDDKMKKASRILLNLLDKENVKIDDLASVDSKKIISKIFNENNNLEIIHKLVEYCIDNNIKSSSSKDYVSILINAIEKGFAKGNHLIITTDHVDKRKKLYKTIEEKGFVIDCSVPQGAIKAEKDELVKIIKQRTFMVCSNVGKKMNSDAFFQMLDLIGSDIRGFFNNLDKLIQYVGDREIITKEDVDTNFEKLRKDPIYEITNALAERNLANVILYLDNLLSNNFLPLQILGALTNQIRKLIVVKDFLKNTKPGLWQNRMSYALFQNKVMPEVIKYDNNLKDMWKKWHESLKKETVESKKKKKIEKIPELSQVLAKNPKNKYPVYQNFIKSSNYSTDELIIAFEILQDVDIRLKSTGQNPRLVLEHALINICKKNKSND